jgi:hypothetical protein
MNNVHEDEPVVFETRWCLSYLRGPLTRTQIKRLMDPVKDRKASEVKGKEADSVTDSPRSSSLTTHPQRPILPPDVAQHFVPLRGSKPDGNELVYAPMLLGSSQIRFTDTKSGIDATQDVTVLTPITHGAVAVDWNHATVADLSLSDLEQGPENDAQFLPLPASASKAKSYADWNKDFGGWLFRTQKVDLLKSPATKEVSTPDESERDFRIRLQQSGREQRDKGAESLRQKYAPKIATLQDRLRRAEQTKERQQAESRSSQVQAAISFGASILGAFLDRKTISATNIGRATTAIRGAGRAIKESQDVGRAEENVEALQQQLADLEAQFKSESNALAAATDPLNEKFESTAIRPTKSNIAVKLVALAWTPHWRDDRGALTQAWQ